MIDQLKEVLTHQHKNVLFVGVGNVLRRDDGVGVYIVDRIKSNRHISTLSVEVSLENYISKILSLAPDVLILVDCIHFNQIPGYTELVPVDDIKEFTVHSHNLSLKRISEFFTMQVFVLGIQPADINVGEQLTYPVIKAGNDIIKLINESSMN